MTIVPNGTCPMCKHPASVIDWPPDHIWISIEGCVCGGFFLWKVLSDFRIPALPHALREELAKRIRSIRAGGTDAWLTTADRQEGGALVIVAERP